ncbi:hypothetical protein WR25_21000 [Diploscapter pachys]|uniref:Uncharacterized protein n=1 Tax=Diploscapter pachys TaxID=2018661 RepID=A0A2A2K3R7_9BILA|nr:hypothetical protein WR25_21000 [Diploscapter pachys]
MIAIGARGGDEYVDARAAECRARHQRHVGNLPARVPHRLQPEQVEDLRLGGPAVLSRLAGPQDEGDLARGAVVLRAIGCEHLVGEALTGHPGFACRHSTDVERVGITTGGQRVGVTDRVLHRPGLDIAASQRRHDRVDLARGVRQPCGVVARTCGQVGGKRILAGDRPGNGVERRSVIAVTGQHRLHQPRCRSGIR